MRKYSGYRPFRKSNAHTAQARNMGNDVPLLVCPRDVSPELWNKFVEGCKGRGVHPRDAMRVLIELFISDVAFVPRQATAPAPPPTEI